MVVSPFESVGTIINILLRIVDLAQTAKSNKTKCRLLKQRVDLIVLFLEELLKSPWMLDSATGIMLNELRDATDRALALVESCQRKKRPWDFFKAYKKAAMFAALQEQITYIMQHFHIANRILMLNLNKQQFFMTVLEKLLLDGACKRLPQSVKEDLKSYISGLKNCDHMSPDAKRLHDRIVRDLNWAAARSGTTSDPSGDAEGATGGYLVDDVVRIANGILEAARTVKPKKKDLLQVRQLARYAEQAIDLLQQLHVPATQDTVRSLREALREGRNIVRDMQLTRSGSYSNEIRSVLYRIECYLQIILVNACSHASNNA